MSPSAIDCSIHMAVASLGMEGLPIDLDCVALCRKMLAGEITMEEYLALVTPKEVG